MLDPDLDDTTIASPTDIAANEALASSIGEYAGAWWRKVKNGESGVLPVLAGLIVIVIIFQVQNSKFLTAGNLTLLLIQGSAFILLGMAEVFVLLLGEIDLSAGYVGAVGAGVTVALAAPGKEHAWWICILAGLLVCAVIGTVQGLIITFLKLPSFVVTLAGLLAFQGVLIWYLNREAGQAGGGTISIDQTKVLGKLVNGNLGVVTGWVLMAIAVALFAAALLFRDFGRRSAGLSVPPFGLVIAKIVALAIAGIVLVVICNTDRGTKFAVVQGVPWVIPLVLAVLAVWTFLLDRTKYGRYVYAIGGNAEAARRAGIKVTRIRVIHVRALQRHRGHGGDRLRVTAGHRSPPTSTAASWCCTPSRQPSSAAPASSAGAAR